MRSADKVNSRLNQSIAESELITESAFFDVNLLQVDPLIEETWAAYLLAVTLVTKLNEEIPVTPSHQSAVSFTIRFLRFWQYELLLFDRFLQPCSKLFNYIRQQISFVDSFLWNSSEVLAIIGKNGNFNGTEIFVEFWKETRVTGEEKENYYEPFSINPVWRFSKTAGNSMISCFFLSLNGFSKQVASKSMTIRYWKGVILLRFAFFRIRFSRCSARSFSLKWKKIPSESKNVN